MESQSNGQDDALRLDCPDCGKSFDVTPEYLQQYGGMTMTCDCGATIAVPAVDDNGESADVDEVPTVAAPIDAFARGVWQDGDMVVVARGTRMPSRCVICNAALDREPPPQTLSWMPPHRQSSSIVGLISWLIASSSAQSIVVRIGRCADHRREFNPKRWGGLLITGGVCTMISLPFIPAPKQTTLTLLGIACVAMAAGGILLNIPRRIHIHGFGRNLAWLKGFGQAYRDALPTLQSAKQTEADRIAATLQ